MKATSIDLNTTGAVIRPKGIMPAPVRGFLSLGAYLFNTVFWFVPIFVFALLKLLLPFKPWRRFCDRILYACANCWVGINNLHQRVLCRIHWDVRGLDGLDPKGWYLLVANHQSWVDILVLQNVFYRKIPFLKFFIKKELIWLPLLGQAWWALDFPFMKRYSKSFLKKHPHLKGKDLETTKKACQKFKHRPVTVMNFVEGTRFTTAKHTAQKSPYTHLLKTRAGGIAYVLGAMGEHLHRIIDVTIVYPDGARSFWDFACGRLRDITVRVRVIDITPEMLGDYAGDKSYRRWMHGWLNNLWAEKDVTIERLISAQAEQPST